MLNQVYYDERALELIAKIAIFMEVDGHRADITMLKTALTNAAFCGRSRITTEDIRVAAELALPHRKHRCPFEDEQADMDGVYKLIEDYGEI